MHPAPRCSITRASPLPGPQPPRRVLSTAQSWGGTRPLQEQKLVCQHVAELTAAACCAWPQGLLHQRSCRLLLQAPRGGLRSAQGSPAAPQGAGKLGGSCALLTLPSMLIAKYFLPFSLLRKSASFHYCSREGDFFGLALQSQSHLQQRLCFKHTSSGYKHSTSPRNVTAGCRYYVTGGSASPLGKGKNKLRTRRALTPPSCPGSHTEKQRFAVDTAHSSTLKEQAVLTLL